jgi:triphosphoribosyl-dephospho-CoA synthase
MSSISQAQLMQAYEQACEIELQAFKPGNVSVYANGHDMTIDDFRVSAAVSAAAITNPNYSLGEKIYYAVKATSEAVGCNTNLGIVLLCAPLVQAMTAINSTHNLRQSLQTVLQNSTVEDAGWVFKAIALASPGGLGNSDQQDVNETPTVTLTQAMRIAAEKDRIALQYITNYKDVFEFAIIRYNAELFRLGISKWAAVSVYAGLLARFTDSHVERKYGNQFNQLIFDRMSELDRVLSEIENPENLEDLLYSIDQEFKAIRVNPGTTADLTVVTIFAFLLGGLKDKT